MRQTPYESPSAFDQHYLGCRPLPPPRKPRTALTYRHKPGLRQLPEDLPVDELTIVGCPNIEELPRGLRAAGVTLQDCAALRRIGDDTEVGVLRVERCPRLERLPDGLKCRELILRDCPSLTSLPARLDAGTLTAPASRISVVPADARFGRLDLTGARVLKRLPLGFRALELTLRRSPMLLRLPAEMHCAHLDVSDCQRFTGWPSQAVVSFHTLNVAGCARLKELPAGMSATRLELADSGLTGLPASMAGAELCWRGVRVTPKIAFEPQRLTADEALHEARPDVRGVIIERMGYERFLAQARPETVDRDCDAGGARWLLRVRAVDGEEIRCISVACPSTGRRYFIRVPGSIATCRQAAAWMAGLADSAEYQPVRET